MSSPGSGYDIVTRPAIFNLAKVYPKMCVQHLPGGTKAGFDRIEAGEVEIATVYIGDGPFAWWGMKDYKKEYRHMRALYQYPPVSTTFMVVLKDSDIMGLKDLHNKRVHLGVAGWTTTRFSLPAALKLHGITQESIKKEGGFVYVGGVGAALDMLSAGKLDAVCCASFQPMGAVMSLNATKGIRILPYTPEEAEAWSLATPGYFPVKLHPGLYKGQEAWPNPSPTIESYVGLMLVSDTVPEDVAFNILCAIWADKGLRFNETHPALKSVDMLANSYYKDFCPIPLHPGAKKFYEKLGFKVAPSWVEKWDKGNFQSNFEKLLAETVKTGVPVKYYE